ncbi:hypothetical protein CGRA01v4_02960 [Colletotrichum graminicola]|nr:hypothetical protein CGRA01v4_02960 [Colletotrichum graminicola]
MRGRIFFIDASCVEIWWVGFCHRPGISAPLLIRCVRVCVSARHQSAMPFPSRNGFPMGHGCKPRSKLDNLKHPSQGQSTSRFVLRLLPLPGRPFLAIIPRVGWSVRSPTP